MLKLKLFDNICFGPPPSPPPPAPNSESESRADLKVETMIANNTLILLQINNFRQTLFLVILN